MTKKMFVLLFAFFSFYLSALSAQNRAYDAVLGIEEYMKAIADWSGEDYGEIESKDYGAISQKDAFAKYKAAADSGDLRAQVAVSFCYENGCGVKVSRKNALSYLERAMEAQYAPAITRYCEMVMTNRAVTTTDAKVVAQILSTSLSKGFAPSYRVLAECYRLGFGVKSNAKTAIDLLEKSKSAKGADAADIDFAIGEIYYSLYQEDKTASDNAREALSHFTSAAEAGSESAQIELVFSFYAPSGLATDANLCSFWYRKSKETYSARINASIKRKEFLKPYWEAQAAKGDAFAMYNLADYYDSNSETREPNLEKCVFYLKKAADGGNEKAAYDLYMRYFSGNGVKMNYDEAKKYRRKSSEYGGDAAADIKRLDDEISFKKSAEKAATTFDAEQYDEDERYEEALLFYLSDGFASVENWKALYPYVEKEAFAGNTSALKMLGDIYFYGYGVAGDLARGLHYYRLAAAMQDEEAMLKVAECYEDGVAVPFDADEAMAWYMAAAYCGSDMAADIVSYYDEFGLIKDDDFNSGDTSTDEELWWTPDESEDISEVDWSIFGEPTVITEDNAPDFAYDVVIMESAESVAAILISSKMLSLPSWSSFCTVREVGEEIKDGEEIIESLWNEQIEGSEDLEFKIYGGTFWEEGADDSILVFSVRGTGFSGDFAADYVFDFAHSDEDGYRVFACRALDAESAVELNTKLLGSLLQAEPL